MTHKDKELLLKDLCARLPYGVVVSKKPINESFTWQELQDFQYGKIYKPYLRPLSSMTEEEINEFILISDTVLWLSDKRSTCTCILSLEQMDWLNEKMFDYRGLIKKGLALEAPEEMYETK